MQKTLPLNNRLLKCASGIDLKSRGHHNTSGKLKVLPNLLKNVLKDEERDQYDMDVHNFKVLT